MIPPKLPIFICHRGRVPRGFPDAALESTDRSPPSPAQSEAGCPGQEPDRVPAPGGRARDAASSGPGTAGPFIVPGRAPSRRVRAANRENGAPRPRRQGEQGVACHPSGKLPPRPTGRLALDGPGPRTAGHPHLRGPAPAPPRRRRSAQRSRGRSPNPDSSPATSSGRFPKLNPFLCQLRAAPPRRQLSSPNFGARGPARRPGRDEGKEGAAATSRRGAAAGPADGEDVGFTQRARSADAPPHGVRARHTPPPTPGPTGTPTSPRSATAATAGGTAAGGGAAKETCHSRRGPARPGPGAPTAQPARRRRCCRARPSFLPAAGDAGGRARGQEPPPPPRKREREEPAKPLPRSRPLSSSRRLDPDAARPVRRPLRPLAGCVRACGVVALSASELANGPLRRDRRLLPSPPGPAIHRAVFPHWLAPRHSVGRWPVRAPAAEPRRRPLG
ncbi:basic salivary proline-rich protein 1-like [Ovis canadensis]|uniref:basic salivary proline-rich protein 1-like n=1 Tax=Ovis canadensis TaxID=37174 RepID=UPI003753CAED